MTREEVYALLNEERQHQDAKWGTVSAHPHEVGGWLTLIRHYLCRAEAAWATNRGDAGALAEVRKLAALTVACMEQHGGGARGSPPDAETQFVNPERWR